MSGKQKTEGVRRIWDKYKFVALVALAGAVLLLWPGGDGKTAERASPQAAALVEAELSRRWRTFWAASRAWGRCRCC